MVEAFSSVAIAVVYCMGTNGFEIRTVPGRSLQGPLIGTEEVSKTAQAAAAPLLFFPARVGL
ncbi:hypothetical protein NOI87_22960 [Neorhizobium galegae]|uniref:hypothetical protein n=1 Tax=Neorhizobium galegae TaxID=399 RepID=UPI0006277BA7|nr:hypothetical protein [Neorhizobium galegae]MCQ1798102.1 hypothetical protein [Neorhizobium galegae]